MCIDFDGEPAYNLLNGTWNTEENYVVAHRMAFSDEVRGQGLSLEAFSLIEEHARRKGIHAFRVDTDNDNSEKIAFDKEI